MSGEPHVTRPELVAELKALRFEMRLLMLALAVLPNLDLPESVTVPAVGALAAKTAWGWLTLQ